MLENYKSCKLEASTDHNDDDDDNDDDDNNNNNIIAGTICSLGT